MPQGDHAFSARGYNAQGWFLNNYTIFKRPEAPMIQIQSNKPKNKATLSNLINIENSTPSCCNEHSERQPTRTSVDDANKRRKRKRRRCYKRNTMKKSENVQEENDTTTPKTTMSPRKFKENTQNQTSTRSQTPIARNDAKENMKIPELENRTSEYEPVSKKSNIHISSCYGSIGEINVNPRKSFLPEPGYHHKFHSTSNSGQSTKNDSEQSKAPQVIKKPRKYRSQSLSCASLKPRFRPKLRAKSLPHLSDIETLSGFNIDDWSKTIKKWRLKPIQLQNVQAKNHLQLDDHCIKRAKKRKPVCSVNSSDIESSPTNPKQAKIESKKKHTKDKEREIKSPTSRTSKTMSTNRLMHDQKAVRPTTRKEMLLLLFGEDSETESETPSPSYAGTTPSKKASECIQDCVQNTLVKGGKKQRKEKSKAAKPAEARPKVSDQRPLVLADLFPDPTEDSEKVVKSANKPSSRSQKPSTQKSTRLKVPQQRCKEKMTPSCIPNATINTPDKSRYISKPKTDIKLTLRKVVAKPVPEPLMAKQKCLAKFERCLPLHLSVPPAKQRAKIVHQEELCKETCTSNAVDVHILLKNEVIVEELTENSEPLLNANNGEAGALKLEDIKRLAVKSESLDMYPKFKHIKQSQANSQTCTVPFQTTRPLSPIACPAKEKGKSSVEEQRCTEKCHVFGIATVKNDSRVMKNTARTDQECLTLYSCPESTNDNDVQIVSVLQRTVPASSILTKDNASAPKSTSVLSFSVDIQSLGSAVITCPAPSSEHTRQRRITSPIRGVTSVTVTQSCSIEPSSVRRKSTMSIKNCKFIGKILFNHVYFFLHLCNAQSAYLNCFEKRMYCKNYFQWEVQMFEMEKNKRIRTQSRQMCNDLLQLNIRYSVNLRVTAEEIVNNLTEQLSNADMPRRVTKSMVYLCLWTLMSEESKMYATVPLFRTILTNSDMVRRNVTTRYSVPFPQEMRQTLMEQIQQYNQLEETTARMSTQTTIRPSLPLYLPSRLRNANSPQRPVPAIETQRIKVLRNHSPHNCNSPEKAAAHRKSCRRNPAPPSVPTQVALVTSQYPNSSTEMPRDTNFAFRINDNFRIRLPYSVPVTSVSTGSSPIMSTAPSIGAPLRSATPQSLDTNRNPDQPVQRPVFQGIAALRSIGRAADMLVYHRTEQELIKLAVDTPSASLSHTSKEKPASSSPLTCAVDPSPQQEQRQPTQDTCSEEKTRRPSSASTGVAETIDLTWLDDMDEEELQEEMAYACVNTEIKEECQQMVVEEGDDEVTYTFVSDTNLCICDEPPKYSCHCAQAWYCGKACQLKDWSSHRYICHLGAETEKTELPLPFTERSHNLNEENL